MAWSAPTELERATPRRVRPSTNLKFTILGMIGVIIVSMLFTSVICFAISYRTARLKTHGALSTGQITNLYVLQTSGHPSYLVQYQFRTEFRSNFAAMYDVGASPVSRQDFEHLTVGQYIDVLFAPSQPGVSALELTLKSIPAYPFEWSYGVIWTVAEVCGAIFSLSLVILYVIYRNEKYLAVWGLAAEARFIPGNGRQELRGIGEIHRFEFDDSKAVSFGVMHEIFTPTLMICGIVIPLKTKTPANRTVVFDPKHSSRNRVYPFFTVTILEY